MHSNVKKRSLTLYFGSSSGFFRYLCQSKAPQKSHHGFITKTFKRYDLIQYFAPNNLIFISKDTKSTSIRKRFLNSVEKYGTLICPKIAVPEELINSGKVALLSSNQLKKPEISGNFI